MPWAIKNNNSQISIVSYGRNKRWANLFHSVQLKSVFYNPKDLDLEGTWIKDNCLQVNNVTKKQHLIIHKISKDFA